MEGKDEHKDEGEAPLDAEVDEEPAIIDWPAALEQVIGRSPPPAKYSVGRAVAEGNC